MPFAVAMAVFAHDMGHDMGNPVMINQPLIASSARTFSHKLSHTQKTQALPGWFVNPFVLFYHVCETFRAPTLAKRIYVFFQYSNFCVSDPYHTAVDAGSFFPTL